MSKNNLVNVVGLFSLFLSVQVAGNLFAYDEPNNFAGLKFGEAFRSRMKECPYILVPGGTSRVPDGAKIQTLGTRCYFGSDGHYGLFNMGEIEHEVDDIGADEVDGKLAHVILGFLPKRASVVRSILEQRYGKPTAQSQQTFVAKRGNITTTSMHAVWKGRKVSITFDEQNAYGLGTVNYETEAWVAHLRQLEAESKRSKSEKLKNEADRKSERIKKSASGL